MIEIFVTEIRQMLIPGYDARHGPLPVLLVVMTLVTGLIDAFSYLVLNHVFVANMTGNVVFLAFAFAGSSSFSIGASLLALGGFVLGSLGGGLLGSRLGHHRGRLLGLSALIQTLLLGAATILVAFTAYPFLIGESAALILVLSMAMGLQNATARKLAVPDLTTTVLTLTIVGLAADARFVGGSGAKAGRRLISVAAMLLGALGGSILIFHVSIIAPLAIAFVLTFLIAIMIHWFPREKQDWIHPD
ncbi:YoaK family protein [Dictyobacter formicarum]|uniref:Membrane protein n=1 Tax=Dictyobacter formicarum TaxID=2778368 RepID=A0ABQ3V9W0_9CHLR|nr:YoaK family protein [Dictyobacter formicarum]GHO82672.1 membrane protein [Dictyobacter formicarum]